MSKIVLYKILRKMHCIKFSNNKNILNDLKIIFHVLWNQVTLYKIANSSRNLISSKL